MWQLYMWKREGEIIKVGRYKTEGECIRISREAKTRAEYDIYFTWMEESVDKTHIDATKLPQ